jgi:hypothetical protein
LPAVYPSDDYIEELRAYTALYLKEEIQNEALTRKVTTPHVQRGTLGGRAFPFE